MKLHKYTSTWFEVGPSGQSEPKYVKGEHYPITDETSAHAAMGHAVEVDAPADADKAEASADKAAKAADAATNAAAAAADAADAAAAAKRIADAAPAGK